MPEREMEHSPHTRIRMVAGLSEVEVCALVSPPFVDMFRSRSVPSLADTLLPQGLSSVA